MLVIDDDPTVHDLVQRFLNKEGLKMIGARSGEEGIRLAKELHPAVITLDVLMPGIDGWAVLTALKADPALSEIPVIMLTIMDEKQMGYALGAADYLTKPIDWERLAAVLQRYECARPPCPVLVVEDDPVMREMLRRRLEKEGWKVIEAENGRVALERMAERQPELILLDLMMPEMDGFQFLDEVRRQEDWHPIPVIVITAKELSPGGSPKVKWFCREDSPKRGVQPRRTHTRSSRLGDCLTPIKIRRRKGSIRQRRSCWTTDGVKRPWESFDPSACSAGWASARNGHEFDFKILEAP